MNETRHLQRVRMSLLQVCSTHQSINSIQNASSIVCCHEETGLRIVGYG